MITVNSKCVEPISLTRRPQYYRKVNHKPNLSHKQ